MTSVVLTNDLKEIVLQQYHPIIDIDLWSLQQATYDNANNTTDDIILNDTVNLKILNKDIEGLLSDRDKIEYQKYISKPKTIQEDGIEKTVNTGTFTNIIFTPQNNVNIIIPYECYKEVFYLELPQFYRKISLHMLTSYFDASDNVALFTTENAIEYVNDNTNPPEKWVSYNNGTSRDPKKINIKGANSKGRYIIKLPDELKYSSSIEIDVFYKYLDAVSNTNHIGVLDTMNRGYSNIQSEYEDQKTLINRNEDSMKGIGTVTRVAQDIMNDNSLSYSSNIDSFALNEHQQDVLYEAIIKYQNDDIYIEEYNARASDEVNRVEELQNNNDYNYKFIEWTED